MLQTNLKIDVLRTFVVGCDLGSFAKAAERVGRSTSAVSLQMHKLEEQIGRSLFRREGRGLALTQAGEALLVHARRLVELNDAAFAAVRGPAIAGHVRLGMPQDFTETWLPVMLARFAKLNPDIRVDVVGDRNTVLNESLIRGALDLALLWGDPDETRSAQKVADLPMAWIGPSTGFARDPDRPLPLVAFAPPCIFRQKAILALDMAEIGWELAFSSPGLSGLSAAVSAGLGVMVRTPQCNMKGLRVLDPQAAGLPPLPRANLNLRMGIPRPGAAIERLQLVLTQTLSAAHAS